MNGGRCVGECRTAFPGCPASCEPKQDGLESPSYDALQPKHTSTKAMQTQPNGSVMILEGLNRGGFWSKLDMGTHEMHLRRLNPAVCKSGEKCPITDYVPKDPEAMSDRFEGLTWVSDNLYLMITDQTWGARLSLVKVTP